MGQSPAAVDLSHVYGSLCSSLPPTPVAATRPFTHRLTLARGEWVSLVGYLEGDLPKRVQAVGVASIKWLSTDRIHSFVHRPVPHRPRSYTHRSKTMPSTSFSYIPRELIVYA